MSKLRSAAIVPPWVSHLYLRRETTLQNLSFFLHRPPHLLKKFFFVPGPGPAQSQSHHHQLARRYHADELRVMADHARGVGWQGGPCAFAAVIGRWNAC